MEWQDMSTAPKDGTRVLLLVPRPPYRARIVGFWRQHVGWTSDPGNYGQHPVAWCALPVMPPHVSPSSPADQTAQEEK